MSVAGAEGHSGERKEPCWSEMSRLEVRVVAQWSARTLHVQGPAWQKRRERRSQSQRKRVQVGYTAVGRRSSVPTFSSEKAHVTGTAAPASPG